MASTRSTQTLNNLSPPRTPKRRRVSPSCFSPSPIPARVQKNGLHRYNYINVCIKDARNEMKQSTDPEQFMKAMDKWMRHVSNLHDFKTSEMVVFRREGLRSAWEGFQQAVETQGVLEVTAQDEQKKGPPLTMEICAARAQICESQAKVCACHARVFESVGECLRAVDNWYEDNKGVLGYKPKE